MRFKKSVAGIVRALGREVESITCTFPSSSHALSARWGLTTYASIALMDSYSLPYTSIKHVSLINEWCCVLSLDASLLYFDITPSITKCLFRHPYARLNLKYFSKKIWQMELIAINCSCYRIGSIPGQHAPLQLSARLHSPPGNRLQSTYLKTREHVLPGSRHDELQKKALELFENPLRTTIVKFGLEACLCTRHRYVLAFPFRSWRQSAAWSLTSVCIDLIANKISSEEAQMKATVAL